MRTFINFALLIGTAAAIVVGIVHFVIGPWMDAHTDLACWTVLTQTGEKQICGMVRK